jgi:hypothetical protein
VQKFKNGMVRFGLEDFINELSTDGSFSAKNKIRIRILRLQKITANNFHSDHAGDAIAAQGEIGMR